MVGPNVTFAKNPILEMAKIKQSGWRHYGGIGVPATHPSVFSAHVLALPSRNPLMDRPCVLDIRNSNIRKVRSRDIVSRILQRTDLPAHPHPYHTGTTQSSFP